MKLGRVSRRGQMSESLAVGVLLSLTGGFQDAYTYLYRDGVFANAQTGNFILMGIRASEGRWQDSFRYLLPIAAFVTGILLARRIRDICQNLKNIHWRQMVLLLEICILFLAGLFPESWNIPANILVSLSCALQVGSFRKIRGNAVATTMCIGNLRSATDFLYAYRLTGDREMKQKSLEYYFFIAVFVAGAVLGGKAGKVLGLRSIWFCCGGLMAALVLMFIKEESASNR